METTLTLQVTADEAAKLTTALERMRMTPQERIAAVQAEKAARLAAAQAMMPKEQLDAIAANQARLDAMTPAERRAEVLLTQKARIEEELASPALCAIALARESMSARLQPTKEG